MPVLTQNDYLDANRGYITASKLKLFLKNREEYKLRYIDEVTLDDEKLSTSLKLGSAFDCIMSFGEQIFLDQYYEDLGLTKAGLAKLYAEKQDFWDEMDDAAQAKYLKALEKDHNKAQLEVMALGDPGDKIRLTAGEALKVAGMVREAKRQPAFDLGSPYDVQVEITASYKGLKLKGTLDRIAFFDNQHNRYLCEDIIKMKKEQGDNWSLYVKEHGIYALLRDWKTAGRIERFSYDMEETFDYITSMAFYFALVQIKFGVQSEVRLDVIESSDPHFSVPYKLDAKRLWERVHGKNDGRIIKGLDAMMQCMDSDIREPVNTLTGERVSMWEMSKSKYYHLLPSAQWDNAVEPHSEDYGVQPY